MVYVNTEWESITFLSALSTHYPRCHSLPLYRSLNCETSPRRLSSFDHCVPRLGRPPCPPSLPHAPHLRTCSLVCTLPWPSSLPPRSTLAPSVPVRHPRLPKTAFQRLSMFIEVPPYPWPLLQPCRPNPGTGRCLPRSRPTRT